MHVFSYVQGLESFNWLRLLIFKLLIFGYYIFDSSKGLAKVALIHILLVVVNIKLTLVKFLKIILHLYKFVTHAGVIRQT